MTHDAASPARSTVRGVGAAQAIAGSLLIAVPASATRWIAGPRSGDIPAWLVRILGARLVVQAGAELARPTRSVALLGAAMDATHALSMLGALAFGRPYRRAVLINAAVATASAAVLAAQAAPPVRPRR